MQQQTSVLNGFLERKSYQVLRAVGDSAYILNSYPTLEKAYDAAIGFRALYPGHLVYVESETTVESWTVRE